MSSKNDEFTEVFSTDDPIEAEMLKDILEGGGLYVTFRSLQASSHLGRIGEIKILVPKESAEAARELIASFGNNK